MRITAQERTAICQVFKDLDPQSSVYLFGSRTDDLLKGGDLDLLVLSETLGFSDRITALSSLKLRLGEQKIDLLIAHPVDASQDPFLKSVLSRAILIS